MSSFAWLVVQIYYLNVFNFLFNISQRALVKPCPWPTPLERLLTWEFTGDSSGVWPWCREGEPGPNSRSGIAGLRLPALFATAPGPRPSPSLPCSLALSSGGGKPGGLFCSLLQRVLVWRLGAAKKGGPPNRPIWQNEWFGVQLCSSSTSENMARGLSSTSRSINQCRGFRHYVYKYVCSECFLTPCHQKKRKEKKKKNRSSSFET